MHEPADTALATIRYALRHTMRYLSLFFLLAAAGCSYYSFTGATIPAQLNTIAIPLVEDNSISPLTGLDNDLTRLLTDRFVGQTRLSLTPDETQADAVLTVIIDRYQNQPTDVSGDEQAALNRVSISVSVVYQDQVEDEELLSRSFTGFAEYNLDEDGLEGESEAAQAALEIVADDIFTAATSNW